MRCRLTSPTGWDPQLDRLQLFSESPDNWPWAHFYWQSPKCASYSNWPKATIFFPNGAFKLAPYSTGTANCGTSPLSMMLTRSVKADRRRDPASAEPWATNERRWPGLKPSGPPEAPAWKDKIPFRTSSSEATAGTTDPSGGSGRLRFSGAEECFSFEALRVSPSWGAKPSAEASSLTAPLTSPSANFAATLLLRVSSPPRTPYLVLGVTCTTGRSVFSKNSLTLKKWVLG